MIFPRTPDVINVNLIIFPQIQEGEDEDEVKANLVKTLKVDESKVDEWFLAETPTIILHDVEEAVAERYEKAINKCGAQCTFQETGKETLSLVPKTANKNTKLFICPSCEHDEEVALGEEIEQCPKCGLILAKWEQKMKEEAEKEKIRRRLLREQRLQEDDSADREARMKELERIKALELEIMKELGIKPPGVLWQFFERHTISVSFAITCFIIMGTGLAFHTVDRYLAEEEEKALAAAEASAEIQGIAPVIGAAMQMQQSGNAQMMNEVADVSQVMAGGGNEARAAIVSSAQQMMKGVDPAKFIEAASKMPMMSTAMSKPAPGMQPEPVNLDTIGGISGLAGKADFDMKTLNAIAPPVLEDGRDEILYVLSEKRMVPDANNPDGPQVIVEAIDEMDGSKILDLMNKLGKDIEWDLFLSGYVRQYLSNQEYDKALELANRIKNPVAKIEVLGEVMSDFQLEGRNSDVKLQMAKIRLALEEIEDPDIKARTLLRIGIQLGISGSKTEPESSFSRVEAMATDADNLVTKSLLHTRLAVAYVEKGDKPKGRRHFANATRIAGQITEVASRISVFTRISQRYYDVRNTTLANEILSEAEVLAATRLTPDARARVFGDIAMARGYMGDFVGAAMAIENASEGDRAKDQLYAGLAQMLIDQERYYQALEIMESISGDIAYSRLELRIISNFLHSNKVTEAHDRIANAADRIRRISDPGDRGLLLSQAARLATRSDDEDLGEVLFVEALENARVLTGRKEQLNRGLVALERARVFHLYEASDIAEQLTDMVVKDPIGNEIQVIERIATTLLPEEALPKRETP